MMPMSFYNLKVKRWTYVQSQSVQGQEQDVYRTSQGWLVSVSKDWPLKGWHVSIHTKGKIREELLDREVQRLFDHLEVPLVKMAHGPLTGAPNYHENIWSEK